MKIEIIQDERKFRDMRLEWNTILEQSSAKSIYLTWEWLNTWWEIFHDNRELFILTIRDNGILVGIAPLLVRHFKYFRLLPFKRVEFLGTGEDENDEVCSNYMDFIVKDNSEKIYETILNYVYTGLKKRQWGEVLLSSVPVASKTFKLLNDRLKDNPNKYGYLVNVSEPVSCAVINLSEQWNDYLHYVDKSWRNQINRGRKEILSKGNIECNLVTESEKLSLAFDEFINLHQKRWQDVGKPGIFSSKKFTDFHKKVLKLFTDRKWVRVRLLKCNGKTVAASYTFSYNKTIYFYSPAYDRDFKTKIGIGLIERSYDIEDAIKGGCRYYDFYKAKEGSYKWHLAKDKKVVCDIHIFRKELTYYLLIGIKHFKTLLKVIKTLCLGKRQV